MEFYFPEVEICNKTGKFSYTWRQATWELSRMRKGGYNIKGFHLEVYLCSSCQRFHIGSAANKLKTKGKRVEPPNDSDTDIENN